MISYFSRATRTYLASLGLSIPLFFAIDCKKKLGLLLFTTINRHLINISRPLGCTNSTEIFDSPSD